MQNKAPETFTDQISRSVLLVIAVQDTLKELINSAYNIPQTAISGFLYGLMHNEESAEAASINSKLRRMYARYELATSIRRLTQISHIDSDQGCARKLTQALKVWDFTELKKDLYSKIATEIQNNEAYAKVLQGQIKALEYLERSPRNMRTIIKRFIAGKLDLESESGEALASSSRTSDDEAIKEAAEEKAEIQKTEQQLKKILHNKKSIYINDLDFLFSLIKKDKEGEFELGYAKKINKMMFQTGRSIGFWMRSLLVIKSLSNNHISQLIFGIVGLCIILPIYVAFFLLKVVQSIAIGMLDIVKMFFLGICASLSTNKTASEVFLMDFKSLWVETKTIYKCLFESASKDVDSDSFHNKSGKQSIMKVLEKLIYELFTKISTNYNAINEKNDKTCIEEVTSLCKKYNESNVALQQLFDDYNMDIETQKRFYEQDQGTFCSEQLHKYGEQLHELYPVKAQLDDNLSKLHKKFEEKMTQQNTAVNENFEIPFFTIETFFQHLHASVETVEVFCKRSAFTVGNDFTDYVMGRREREKNSNELLRESFS